MCALAKALLLHLTCDVWAPVMDPALVDALSSYLGMLLWCAGCECEATPTTATVTSTATGVFDEAAAQAAAEAKAAKAKAAAAEAEDEAAAATRARSFGTNQTESGGLVDDSAPLASGKKKPKGQMKAAGATTHHTSLSFKAPAALRASRSAALDCARITFAQFKAVVKRLGPLDRSFLGNLYHNIARCVALGLVCGGSGHLFDTNGSVGAATFSDRAFALRTTHTSRRLCRD